MLFTKLFGLHIKQYTVCWDEGSSRIALDPLRH